MGTVVLLLDSHTTEFHHLKAPFNEAKIYFDGKNHIYGLKTEVAISASVPYYCVLVGNHRPGSVHDFEILKQGYQKYLDYLHKLPAESAALPSDCQSWHWAVLVDMGYIGPEYATPDFHWITPIKNPVSPQEVQYNQSIGRVRVHIE